MIKRSCLYALVFFVFYAAAVLYLPTGEKSPEGQSIFQGNIIRAQTFMFSSNADHIFVGSSLTHLIDVNTFGSNYFNLAMPGDSFGTGMELIRRSARKPKCVFVESNFFLRAQNQKLVNTFDDPILGTLRQWVPVFRERYQPIVVVMTELSPWLTAFQRKLSQFQSKLSRKRATKAAAWHPAGEKKAPRESSSRGLVATASPNLVATASRALVATATEADGAATSANLVDNETTNFAKPSVPPSTSPQAQTDSDPKPQPNTPSPQSRPKSGGSLQSERFDALVKVNRRSFDPPFAKGQLTKNVELLKEHIRELEAHGTTFVFFEMPVHPSIRDSEGAQFQRKLLLQEFPPDKYKWVFPKSKDEFQTMDGLHLVRDSAYKFECFLKAEFENQQRLMAGDSDEVSGGK